MEKTAIGFDMEENNRFKDKSEAFYNRLFTPAELTYCRLRPHPEQHFAARYCAKEATIKALQGLGSSGISYRDIEIKKDGNLPRIILDGFCVSISLSHMKDYSAATALVTKL